VRVLAIARNTFREAVRDRVVHLLFVFSLVLIAGSRVLSPLALGEGEKIVKDLGLSLIGLFGVLLVVFIGSSTSFSRNRFAAGNSSSASSPG